MSTHGERPARRRAVAAWCLYDFANSPVPTVVLTFVLPAYFVQAVAADAATATAQWALVQGLAALVIALAGPVLGAVADQGGGRKAWLGGFTALMAVACALLWTVEPTVGDGPRMLVLAGAVVVTLELGVVFYNAMLPRLVTAATVGRVSGWAWGLGYLGGLAGLVVVLFGFVQANPVPFGLDRESAEHVRIAGPLVAAWVAVFSLPLFLLTPDQKGGGASAMAAIRSGLGGLIETVRRLRESPVLARFLIARMLYIDGVNTIFAFGGIYAAGTFGLTISEVILFGIVLNVTAGAGAFVFGWVDDRIGPRPTILVALAGMVVCGIPVLTTPSVTLFWVFGAALGVFVGPVQSASRSMMVGLVPAGREGELFGLYALTGRVTAFVGPWLVGLVVATTGSQRWGLAVVMPLLISGGILLAGVRAGGRVSDGSDGRR